MAINAVSCLVTRSLDENGAKIVDVGVGRTGDHLVAQLFEQTMGIVVLEHRHRIKPKTAGPRQAGWIDHSAGNLLHAVNAIGIGSDGVHAAVTAQGDSKRQQELDIAAAAALAAHGDAGFTARQQQGRLLHRLVMRGDLKGDGGMNLGDVTRLAFDAVTEIEHVRIPIASAFSRTT